MPVNLNTGDIWRYWETTSSSRYSENELKNMVRGGVILTPIYFSTQLENKVFEKYLIYGYYFNHGNLPPGNKIFNRYEIWICIKP